MISYDLTLSAILKRIAYDASEMAIGDQMEADKVGDGLTEEYSEQLAKDLLEYYQDELSWKQRVYDKEPLDPTRLFICGWDLYEDIQQIKAIIEIIKTNENGTINTLEKTKAP